MKYRLESTFRNVYIALCLYLNLYALDWVTKLWSNTRCTAIFEGWDYNCSCNWKILSFRESSLQNNILMWEMVYFAYTIYTLTVISSSNNVYYCHSFDYMLQRQKQYYMHWESNIDNVTTSVWQWWWIKVQTYLVSPLLREQHVF